MSVVLAFLLDCLLGDPYKFPHPVKFMGKYIRRFEKFVRRKTPTENKLRYFYGPLLTLSTIAIFFMVTFIFLKLLKELNYVAYLIANVIMLWTTIAPRCLSEEGYKVYLPLSRGDIEGARERVSYLVSRDTKELSEKQICKAAIETVLENISDGIIAPLFYAFIGGAPLAMAYKAVNTLDSMVGYRNEKYENFGFFSAKVDDVFNFIPARITGILIIMASFILRYDYKSSFKIFFRDRKNHKSPNSAHPESAGAGALNIRIGGPTSYFGKIVEKPYIGEEVEELKGVHIIKSIKLLYISTVIFIGIYALVLINI